MRILFLPSWYPNRKFKTEGIFIKRHAIAFSKNFEIEVFFSKPIEKTRYSYWEIHQINNNLREYILYYPKLSNGPLVNFRQSFWHLIAMCKLFFKILKRPKYSIVHSHVLTIKTILAYLYKKIRGSIWIHTEHWSKFLAQNKHQLTRTDKILLKILNRQCDIIITVSENLKKNLQDLNIKKPAEVIYNAVDPMIFKPINNHRPKNPFKFLHVSTLDEKSKNITGILKAIDKLNRRGNSFIFTFVSDGDIQTLMQKIEKFVIDKSNIKVIGEVEQKKLSEIYNEHDCLVMFSNYENMPCVIEEALCCGIPVIATKVGGIPEVIHNFNGILIEPDNIDELVNKMEWMMNHHSIYDKNTITKDAYKFTDISVEAKYRKIISAITTKDKPLNTIH